MKLNENLIAHNMTYIYVEVPKIHRNIKMIMSIHLKIIDKNK